MSILNNSKATHANDKEPVFRLNVNLTESTIVAILTLLVGVGFGVQIGGSSSTQSGPESPVHLQGNTAHP